MGVGVRINWKVSSRREVEVVKEIGLGLGVNLGLRVMAQWEIVELSSVCSSSSQTIKIVTQHRGRIQNPSNVEEWSTRTNADDKWNT